MLETKKYVLTVEGETEQWYFNWLKDQINHCEDKKYNVAIIFPVQSHLIHLWLSSNPLIKTSYAPSVTECSCWFLTSIIFRLANTFIGIAFTHLSLQFLQQSIFSFNSPFPLNCFLYLCNLNTKVSNLESFSISYHPAPIGTSICAFATQTLFFTK